MWLLLLMLIWLLGLAGPTSNTNRHLHGGAIKGSSTAHDGTGLQALPNQPDMFSPGPGNGALIPQAIAAQQRVTASYCLSLV
ncbi:hypothetical protein [Aeromonas sp. 30P]|uniref:hypothetical protein n=1 Tax=Aeromonas sp. 30P TaxID=3452717 RepID=UPI003F78EA21